MTTITTVNTLRFISYVGKNIILEKALKGYSVSIDSCATLITIIQNRKILLKLDLVPVILRKILVNQVLLQILGNIVKSTFSRKSYLSRMD